MRLAPFALILACSAASAPACGGEGSAVAEVDSVVTDGRYTNEYFGLTLPIPDGWFVASEDSERFLRAAGRAAVGDDALAQAAIDAAQETTFQLLTLSEFELGAAVESNPSLILMAERVSHVPGIRSGADYLFHLAKFLERSDLPYEMGDAQPAQLGHREWSRMDAVLEQPQLSVYQSYYALKHGDYVLAVILSGASDEQMAELERVADAIEL